LARRGESVRDEAVFFFDDDEAAAAALFFFPLALALPDVEEGFFLALAALAERAGVSVRAAAARSGRRLELRVTREGVDMAASKRAKSVCAAKGGSGERTNERCLSTALRSVRLSAPPEQTAGSTA